MNKKYLQTTSLQNSCPEFMLEMGLKPIFSGEAGTQEFPGSYGWGGAAA